MLQRDIVVIGASAGGVQALKAPGGWIAFRVSYRRPGGIAHSHVCSQPVARDSRPCRPASRRARHRWEPILPGRIYVACADRHLMIEEQLARARNDLTVAKECAEQADQAEQRVQRVREVVLDKDMLGHGPNFF